VWTVSTTWERWKHFVLVCIILLWDRLAPIEWKLIQNIVPICSCLLAGRMLELQAIPSIIVWAEWGVWKAPKIDMVGYWLILLARRISDYIRLEWSRQGHFLLGVSSTVSIDSIWGSANSWNRSVLQNLNVANSMLVSANITTCHKGGCAKLICWWTKTNKKPWIEG
jgi:hypothetical protein